MPDNYLASYIASYLPYIFKFNEIKTIYSVKLILNGKIAIDTTYILPSLGVKIEEFSQEDLEAFFKTLFRKGCIVILSDVSLIEALGKSLRYAILSEEKIEILRSGYLSILTDKRIQVISHVDASIFEVALDLRMEGLEDLFDCLIAGTAITHSEALITEDDQIRRVIKRTTYAYFPVFNFSQFMGKTS